MKYKSTSNARLQRNALNPTSENMPKLPLNIMEIPSNQFLSWRLQREILQDKIKGFK